MDRARRAEPYSNATIWTREIARNLAGHLDRLSKAHSCVDSTSPKYAPQSKQSTASSLPLKRAGQVSPLKPTRSAPVPPVDEERDQRRENSDECGTARDESDLLHKCPTSGRRRPRPKSLKKIKTVARRTQLETSDHDSGGSLETERQQQSRPVELGGYTTTGSHYDSLEAPQAPANAKKTVALDYHRRQEQQRIWHANQKLAQRLRNTKPTLKSKDWEKGDKWNQSFLKTQERRRQALHHEMARTLASPHSALIRVKPIVHTTGGHLTGRPHTDYGLGDNLVTAIEVMASDTTMVGRDLRRRRSADEDMGTENRHLSTAPNHRRILELRKQKEQGERRPQPRSNDETEGITSDTGPPDELVSVRFTFSRGESRVRCTPSGITGRFSPAVELEAALEASYHNEEVEEEALLLPLPLLDLPESSRVDTEEHDDASDEVFNALQACIDMVVLIAEQAIVVQEDESSELSSVSQSQDAEEVVAATSPVVDTPQDPAITEPEISTEKSAVSSEIQRDEIPVYMPAEPPEHSVAQEEDPRKHPEPAAANLIDQEPGDPSDVLQPADDTETLIASENRSPLTMELEASAYRSEFDGEESPTIVPQRSPELEPLPVQPEEPEETEYEDDHVSENDYHNDGEEPQFDDDLESETDHGAKDDEHSYDDEGFADDDE